METKELVPVNLTGRSMVVRGGAIVAGVATLGIIGTLAVKALMAGLALFALGGVAVAGIACYKLYPYFGQKFDNLNLLLQKKEAAAHPIEQMENFYNESVAQAEKYKQGIYAHAAQIKEYENFITDILKDDPGHDVSEAEENLRLAEASLQKKIDKFNEMAETVKALKAKISAARVDYKIALANAKLVQGMDESDAKEAAMKNLLLDEAFRSVREKVGMAFANLNIDDKLVSLDGKPSKAGKASPAASAKTVPTATHLGDDLGLAKFEEIRPEKEEGIR